MGEPAIKHDVEKPDMSLLPVVALTEVAAVLTYGKLKYSAHNWRNGFNWTRLTSAALRHLFFWLAGQDLDPETGFSHIAHACCCLLFLIDHTKLGYGSDDRYSAKINGGNK